MTPTSKETLNHLYSVIPPIFDYKPKFKISKRRMSHTDCIKK